MIKRFLLRVAQQAIEEFVNPLLDKLRADIEATFDARFTAVEARLEGIERRLDEVEKRLGNVEGRLDEVERRLEELGRRLGNVEKQQGLHSDQLARLDQRVIDLKETLDVERRLARLEAQAGFNAG